MGEHLSQAGERAGNRDFGVGDILVYGGAALNVVLLIVLLVKGTHGSAGWYAASLVVLLLMHLLAGVAQVRSLECDCWLKGPMVLSAFLGFDFVARMSPLSGSDPEFFLLLGAAAIGAGAWLAEKRIGALPSRKVIAPDGADARLAQLKRMRDGGLISQEDYDAKRREILDRL